MKSIKEINKFCVNHNLLIQYNRQRQHCGFKPDNSNYILSTH